MQKRTLIITSSGGAGHLQAAASCKKRLLQEDSNAIVIEKDILYDLIGKRCTGWAIKRWNQAMRDGNPKTLQKICNLQPLSAVVFWPLVVARIMRLLITHKITHVIDTQANNTHSIIKAIRWTSFLTKRSISLERVITELPTNDTTYFFREVRALSKKDRKSVSIRAVPPFLKNGDTESAFWKRHCRIELDQVSYDTPPLSAPFLRLKKTPVSARNFIIKLHSNEEFKQLDHLLKKSPLFYFKENDKLHLKTLPQDKIYSIMLGSQPAIKATLKYIEGFIKLAEKQTHITHHLFVFCRYNKSGCSKLLQYVYAMMQSSLPSNLTLVPMCSQEPETVAKLFHTSDVTVTRSGGLTAMELLWVAKGQILIHSEAPLASDMSEQHLLSGMPKWEAGNARYLGAKKGAKCVSPVLFEKDPLSILTSSLTSNT